MKCNRKSTRLILGLDFLDLDIRKNVIYIIFSVVVLEGMVGFLYRTIQHISFMYAKMHQMVALKGQRLKKEIVAKV